MALLFPVVVLPATSFKKRLFPDLKEKSKKRRDASVDGVCIFILIFVLLYRLCVTCTFFY